MIKPMSDNILGMLRDACEDRLPSTELCSGTTLRACLGRKYFTLISRHRVRVTSLGLEVYERMRLSHAPVRKKLAPLSSSVMEYATWKHESNLHEITKRRKRA